MGKIVTFFCIFQQNLAEMFLCVVLSTIAQKCFLSSCLSHLQMGPCTARPPLAAVIATVRAGPVKLL